MKLVPIFLLLTLPLFVIGQQRVDKGSALAFLQHSLSSGIKHIDRFTAHVVHSNVHLTVATKVNSKVKTRKINFWHRHIRSRHSDLDMVLRISLTKQSSF